MQETWVQSLGREDPLEKEMTPHLSTLAWEIPWIEEPSGLESMGLQGIGHSLVTEHARRKDAQKVSGVGVHSFWLQ